MSSVGDDRLATLIGDLSEASKLPAKRRAVSVKPTVNEIADIAYEKGLRPDELKDLVDLVTRPSHLDQASLGAIVRNLYPSAVVSDELVLKVVGSLGHGQLKPSLALQSLLLRWLILTYHLMSSHTVLSQSYAVLFNLLDTAAIRPQISHILALITRRKHVRPFRIQAILGLSRQTGNDPALLGLLRVYKNYYPEVIVGEATRGRASPFKHPDPQWRARADEIRLAQLQRSRPEADGPQNGFRVHHPLQRQTRGTLVPAVHTAHAKEDSVTLEEIDSAESLVRNLEKIEMPNQLIAVLSDPLLQKFMLLRPQDEGFARVEKWISSFVTDAATGDTSNDELLDLLEVVHDYITSTKALPSVMQSLLREALRSWNGRDRKDTVLELLAYSPLLDFTELYHHLLQPLEFKLLDNTPDSQLSLLRFYTKLLRHWTTSLLARTDIPQHAASTVRALTEHVNKLCMTLIQTLPATSTHLEVLDFLESVTAIIARPTLASHMQIMVPPPALVYILFFSQSLAVVSRLCAILAVSKRNLETVMGRPANRQLTAQEREHVNIFNGFLMDICNCLWRGRAFAVSDVNAMGCRIPQSMLPPLTAYVNRLDRELSLSTCFALSHSPTLSLQAISHLRELEEAEINRTGGELYKRHAGPVTQASLQQLGNEGGLKLTWQAYRSGVLQYLEDNGLGGISSLLYNTMKNLKKVRTT